MYDHAVDCGLQCGCISDVDLLVSRRVRPIGGPGPILRVNDHLPPLYESTGTWEQLSVRRLWSDREGGAETNRVY